MFKKLGIFNRNLDLFNTPYQFDTEFEMKFIRHMVRKSKNPNKNSVVTITDIKEKYSKVMEMQKNVRSSLREFCSEKIMARNLIVLMVLWFLTVFTYDTLKYQLPSPDNIGDYNLIVTGAFFELSGFIIGGVLFSLIGPKRIFYISGAVVGACSFVNIFQDGF